MKPIMLLAITSLLIFKTGYSQTNQDEYNYITKALQQDLANGRGVKSGYRIEMLDAFDAGYSDARRVCAFKGFYKDSATMPSAYIMIYLRPDTKYEEYFCIPVKGSSKELYTQMFDQISKHANEPNVTNMYSTMIYGLMRFVGSMNQTQNP